LTVETFLVLAEKPDAANKLARALSADGLDVTGSDGVFYLSKTYDGRHYVVCSALGHLYELIDQHARRSIFPVLDVDWRSKENKAKNGKNVSFQKRMADFLVQKKIEQIASSMRGCTKIVNACDFDPEGETIGFNALVFAMSFTQTSYPILRAKFSTLTIEEIREAFRELSISDDRLSEAGRLRHMTDFFLGVNLSRALTVASNKALNSAATVTIGRVQGPALAFVVKRDVERLIHVPVPSWIVTCKLEKSKEFFVARYSNLPIRIHSKALEVYNSVSNATIGKVKSVSKNLLSVPPRYPFDLGELQKEAYRLYKLSPKTTLSMAQNLYQKALVSYPRTDSQKLPEKLGYPSIFRKLAIQQKYSGLISRLNSDPKRRTKPWEGPKDDPAHPAIYPTGENPSVKLPGLEEKIYNLIVRRFCNVFASNEIIEKTKALFDISSNDFISESSTLIEEGWTLYYPFSRDYGDSKALTLIEGEEVRLISASIKEDLDPPPRRFSEGSLLAHMEIERIGTKATRAETIATLIDRGYIEKTRQELVPLQRGIDLFDNVESISPIIISTKLTRDLEAKLDLVRSGSDDVIDFVIDMLDALRPIMRSFRNQKFVIENSKHASNTYQRQESVVLGRCPNCGSGKLELIRSRATMKRFVRCTNFGSLCGSSSPALPRGRILSSSYICQFCQWPIILIVSAEGRTTKICSNYSCILKRGKSK
jgi:DNA topoisomerase I